MPQEIQAAPTSAETPQESYVQSIIGTAGDLGSDETTSVEAQPQQTDATDSKTTSDLDATKVDEQKAATGTPPTVDELIQQFAKEHDLNPDDPNQRKILKRLADKELFIQKLQAGNTPATQAAPATTGPELLTAFEQELAAEKAPELKAPATEGKEPPATGKEAAADATKYGDVGDGWKTPEESLSALNEAWAENDLKRVHEIEMGRLRRNFDQGIAPQLLRFVEQMVENRLKGFAEKDLGDIVPEVRRGVSERRMADSREFAIEELRKAGAGEIDKLFTTEDGQPITFEGQQFPNTPLNRILAKHPEIMRIMETHPDPAKAERKTFISRYKLAYQIYKQQGAAGISAETAKTLVAAGREAKDRESNDRARQAINAGPGATGLGTKPVSKSYVTDLNNLPGEVPFGSLIS